MAPTAAVVVVVVAMMMVVVVVTACRIRKKKDMAEDVSDEEESAFVVETYCLSAILFLKKHEQKKDPYEFAYKISHQKNCCRYD